MTFHVFISIQIKQQNESCFTSIFEDTAKLYVQFLDQNRLQI